MSKATDSAALKDFIQYCVQQGISLDRLQGALAQSGFDRRFLDQAFAEARGIQGSPDRHTATIELEALTKSFAIEKEAEPEPPLQLDVIQPMAIEAIPSPESASMVRKQAKRQLLEEKIKRQVQECKEARLAREKARGRFPVDPKLALYYLGGALAVTATLKTLLFFH